VPENPTPVHEFNTAICISPANCKVSAASNTGSATTASINNDNSNLIPVVLFVSGYVQEELTGNQNQRFLSARTHVPAEGSSNTDEIRRLLPVIPVLPWLPSMAYKPVRADIPMHSYADEESSSSEGGSTDGYSVQVPGLVVATAFTPPDSQDSGSGSSMDSSLQISSSSNEPNAPGSIAAMMLVPAQQNPTVFNPFAVGSPSSGQQTQASASSSDEDNALAIRGASRPIQRSRPHSADSRRAALPYSLPTNQPVS